MPRKQNTEKDFWSFVDKDPDGCWYWRGCLISAGYGCISIDNKLQRAHRVAFFYTFGRWPIGDLDHLCKTRHCVNPAHLEEVSNRENTRRGSAAVLTKNNVIDIKQCLAVGFKTNLIASMFNVSQPTICNIAAERRWKDI